MQSLEVKVSGTTHDRVQKHLKIPQNIGLKKQGKSIFSAFLCFGAQNTV